MKKRASLFLLLLIVCTRLISQTGGPPPPEPQGDRPLIQVTLGNSGPQQPCSFGHGACSVPPASPQCSYTICTGELVDFCTVTAATGATIPMAFYNTIAGGYTCDGTAGHILWTFPGSNTAPIYDVAANWPQNAEICHSGIFWSTPGVYTVDIYYESLCCDCGSTIPANYDWNIVFTVVGSNITPTSTAVSCFGGNDGTASVPFDANSSYGWAPTGGYTSTATGLTAGTYTVTIMDGNFGCVSEVPITVTEPPLLVTTIDPTNEHCFIANDGEAQAYPSGGTPPYTYSWSNLQTSQTATNLDAGIASVIVTDANGCTATGTVSIGTDFVPAPIITTNNTSGTLCDGTNIVYDIVNYNGSLNYTFGYSQPPSSVTILLNSHFIINWGTATNDVTFTVTVDNGNPLCSVTTSVTIYSCCVGVGPTNPNMFGTLASNDVLDLQANYNPSNNPGGFITYNPPQTIYTYNNPNGVLYINGTFTVPNGKTFVIKASEVRFGALAKIDLVGNAKLEIINGSHLHAGCNTMWDGIYVNQNALINVNGNSLIEDALHAVVSIGGGQYTIADAIFNKNRIAVDVQQFTTGNHQGTIRNTIITCRNIPINPTYAILKGPQTAGFIQVYPVSNYSAASLLSPYATGTRSYAGVNVDRVGATILNGNQVANYTGLTIGVGSNYGEINIFDNLDYGIYANQSNVTVNNNAFQYMTGPTSVVKSGTEYGIAIYGIADGHPGFEKVFVVGNPTGNPPGGIRNTFFECNRSIDLNAYYKTTVFKNRFQSKQTYSPIPQSAQSPTGNYAAFIKTGRYIGIDVVNNDIVNWNVGIALFGDVVIYSNGQQYKFFGDARINNNRVCPTETNFGTISTQGVRQAIIAQNIIPSCSPSCLQTLIFGRLYIDDNDLNNVFNGISIQGWLVRPQIASTLGNNQNIYLRYQAPFLPSTFPQAGIRAVNCASPVIYNNHINGDYQNLSKTLVRGIYVTTSASANVKCNDIINVGQCMVFEGTSANSTVFKNFMYKSQGGFVLLNNGKIGPQGSPPIPILAPNGISSDNQWVGPFSHAATFTNNTFAPNTHSPFYYRNNIPVEHPTLGLNLTNGNLAFDTYNVLGAFIQVPQAAQGTNCNLPPSLIGSGTGQPNQKLALQNIVQDTTTSDSTGLWLRKQQVYSMIRKDPTWMNNSAILQQFYNTTQPTNIGVLDSVDVALSDNNLSTANNVNATVSAQLLVEQNQKIVNIIYASLMNGDSATTQQISDLTNIANQCPLTGGNGVYRARTMLCLIMDEVIFFEDSCTINFSSARMIQPEEESGISHNNSCNVFPNPNDGQISLSYNAEQGRSVSFAVYDLTGRELVKYSLQSGEQIVSINLSEFSSGMYYYTFYLDGKPEKSEKIIISK